MLRELYHRSRLTTSALVVGFALALTAPHASAQVEGEAEAAERERALAMFRDGSDAYREGRFEDASRLFRDAYVVFPEPVLLYNLARAEENLGRWDAAADAYERYLSEEENAEDRPGIERRVITLRERAAEAEAEAARAREEPTAPEPAPPRETPIPWASIVTGAVGVAGIVAAAALGQVAVDRWAEARDEPVHQDAVRIEASALDLALGANVTYGVAGAVLVGAAVTLLLELLVQ